MGHRYVLESMMENAKKKATLRCPTCGTLVLPDEPEVPFCSDRCRLIDLGKWASGAYRISSPIVDPEVLEGLDAVRRQKKDEGVDE
jgi:endogenous inhibitor of DNA gyrase (YacG/DUF329 family)